MEVLLIETLSLEKIIGAMLNLETLPKKERPQHGALRLRLEHLVLIGAIFLEFVSEQITWITETICFSIF